MDWAILIFEILLAVAVFLIGLFVKNYLPSYMDEKGKNLATKEDIEEITRKTEEVQQEFREGFELFSNDVKFKYDFFYKQYSELYCKLYAIIIQSEYCTGDGAGIGGASGVIHFGKNASRSQGEDRKDPVGRASL